MNGDLTRRAGGAVIALAVMMSQAATVAAARSELPSPVNAAALTRAPLAQVSAYEVTEGPDGVRVSWRGLVSAAADETPMIAGWDSADPGASSLPMRSIALRVADGEVVAPRFDVLRYDTWTGRLPSVEQPVLLPMLDDTLVDRPYELQPVPAALPTSPVSVIADSRMRGVRIVVLAVSPVFEKAGVARAASEFQVTIPNARLLTSSDTRWDLEPVQSVGASTTRVGSVLAPDDVVAPPTNTAALTDSVRITVTNQGLQRITRAMLVNGGVNITPSVLSTAKVFYRGTEIPLHVIDGGTPDAMDNGDEIRFYATRPGDIWNNIEVYWMTFGGTPGLRASTRSVTPAAATLRSTAFQESWVSTPRQYDSLYAAVDGLDHWFTVRFRSGGAVAGTLSTVNVTMTKDLPLAAGTAFVTPTLRVVTGPDYIFRLTSGAAAPTRTVNLGVFDRFITFTVAITQNNEIMALAQLNLTNTTLYRESLLHRVYYRRPVTLTFTGGLGAEFTGDAGAWRYQVTDATADRVLYDVSNPLSLTVLSTPAGTTFQFEDGSAGAFRKYLLTGAGSTHTPNVLRHVPVDVSSKMDSQALYLGPANFAEEIAPLVALRQAQGYPARFVSAQAIYDAWSFGRVSPLALRDFLRYAASTWDVIPVATTLVGDSTYDPRNYRYLVANVMPTYWLPTEPVRVERFVGETSCDACIGQLDGAMPVPETGFPDQTTLFDVAIGRFPVRTEADVTTMVNKLIAYELQTGGDRAWQQRAGYLSDNYACSGTSGCVYEPTYPVYVDPAGNFYSATISMRSRQPGWATSGCVWYNPVITIAVTDPCFEPDAVVATSRAISIFNQGAAFVLYNGHGAEFAIANTTASPLRLLLRATDVPSMNNGYKLPVVAQMTCLTSRFQYLDTTGADLGLQSMDEAMVLKPTGGAIATFGGTGKAVATAHEPLQRGFVDALWVAPNRPTLAQATRDAFLSVFSAPPNIVKQDVMFTFVLLGDPLMKVKLFGPKTYLPATLRVASSGW